jgi:hypothetical protein
MNVIDLNILFHDLTPWHTPEQVRKKLPQVSGNARIQDAVSILWNPNNVILRLINAMAR